MPNNFFTIAMFIILGVLSILLILICREFDKRCLEFDARVVSDTAWEAIVNPHKVIFGTVLILRTFGFPWIFAGWDFTLLMENTPENPLFEAGDLPGGGGLGMKSPRENIVLPRQAQQTFTGSWDFVTANPARFEFYRPARLVQHATFLMNNYFIQPQIMPGGLWFNGVTPADRIQSCLHYYGESIFPPKTIQKAPRPYEHFSYTFEKEERSDAAEAALLGFPEGPPRDNVWFRGQVSFRGDTYVRAYIRASLAREANYRREAGVITALCTDALERDIAWIGRGRTTAPNLTARMLGVFLESGPAVTVKGRVL